MNRFLHFAAVLLLIGILAAVGCENGTGGGASPQEQAELHDFEPVTEIKDGQKNIYVVLKVMTSQYWQDIIRGITDAGKELNCNVYIGGPSGEGDWESQKKLLDKAVNELGADAIIISPASSSALIDDLSEIHDSGLPVILVDTTINGSGYDACYMTDNLQAGEFAAKEMVDALLESGVSPDENASIAIQITSVSSQTIIDRLAGFNQYWAVNAPSGWVVLDEVKTNNGNKERAKQNCVDFLADYPDIKGFFGCNNSSTVGFVEGVTEAGRKDIVLVGFDYADETAALVADDEYRASTVVQNQYDMGYDGLKNAVGILDGDENEYKFIDTGVVVINKSNYKEYEAGVDKK